MADLLLSSLVDHTVLCGEGDLLPGVRLCSPLQNYRSLLGVNNVAAPCTRAAPFHPSVILTCCMFPFFRYESQVQQGRAV